MPPYGYSYRLAARVLLYAFISSHIQDNTYHGLCYTSRGALAGTRNSSMGILRVNCNVMVYFEFGRIPMDYIRLFRMTKYWFKLLSTRNSIFRETVLFNLTNDNVYNVNWVSF